MGESSIRASSWIESIDGRIVNLSCCFDLEGDRDGDDNSFRSTKGMGPTGTERDLWRPGVTALDLVDGNDDKEDGFFGNLFWTRRETSFSESLPSRFCLFNTLSHSTRGSFSGKKGRLWRPVESASGVIFQDVSASAIPSLASEPFMYWQGIQGMLIVCCINTIAILASCWRDTQVPVCAPSGRCSAVCLEICPQP